MRTESNPENGWKWSFKNEMLSKEFKEKSTLSILTEFDLE